MCICVCACAYMHASVCVCMSLSQRLLITSGMMWCDMNSIWLAAIVGIVIVGVALELKCIVENSLANKSKLSLYKPLLQGSCLRPSLVYCLFPVPMNSKNRGRQEVLIDYLLCQCTSAVCLAMHNGVATLGPTGALALLSAFQRNASI